MPPISQPLPPSLERIVQRFQQISEPKQRYEQLIWFAKRLQEFPTNDKVPENKVPGCVSQVYITANLEDGKVKFQGDSDSQLTLGLVALLVEGLSELTPEKICRVSPDFIQETGLNVSLTPYRSGFRRESQRAGRIHPRGERRGKDIAIAIRQSPAATHPGCRACLS